jgi:hypothetical protein
MEPNTIGDAAEQARETSRKATGRFGAQPHHDSGVVTVEPVREASLVTLPDGWTPSYSQWRHGGWYVENARYLSGAVGCVSRNFPDRKWRIVCHHAPFEEQPTFKSRDEAAAAEYLYARTPSVLRRDIAGMKRQQGVSLALGIKADSVIVTQYAPRIAEAERLLTDNGYSPDAD